MRQIIYDRSNKAIGYLVENCNQVQVYDENNRLLGYYNKASDITFRNGNYFGRGDQTMRLLGS
jgi:hypothetical protein